MPLTSSAPLVKTSVYEGPLDLLLELIEKRKLLINDISLTAVAEEYIARLNEMPDLPVGETAQFVSLAATLLLIKSRSLLPLLSLSEEEGQDIKELEYRLSLYQIIKASSRGILTQEVQRLYEGESPELEAIFLPDETVNLSFIETSARTLIEGFPKPFLLPRIDVQKILSIEEVIQKLSERIANALRLSFKEFTKSTAHSTSPARHDIIVSFLALLELVKQGIIKATQEHSGDITLESDTVSTPLYE